MHIFCLEVTEIANLLRRVQHQKSFQVSKNDETSSPFLFSCDGICLKDKTVIKDEKF